MSLAEIARMKQSARTAAFRMKIRGQFFDRPKIKRLLGEANHKAMNKPDSHLQRTLRI
mgnify:CR=1 FL=1